MGKLFCYEWRKLGIQRLFWFLTAALLLTNLLTLYQYEKNKDCFYYYYLQKEDYQKYQSGSADAENTQYYESAQKEAQDYAASYASFWSGIATRAEQLKKTQAYADTDTFIYRNLDKTVQDYGALSQIQPQAGNDRMIREFASYHYGLFFVLIFMVISAYFLFFAERGQGLFLLIKGTKKGHVPLITAKWLVFVPLSMCFSLLSDVSSLLLLGYFYGLGDLGRCIQSVPMFRNCTLPCSIGQAAVLLLLTHMLSAAVISCILFGISMILRNEGAALCAFAGVFGLEFIFAHTILISSRMNFLKCINPFFVWDMENLFGVYQNLNLFGYPTGKTGLAAACGGILGCIMASAGIWRFHAACQIASENRMERLFILLRKASAVFWRHTNLFAFEWAKVFELQKRSLLLAVMLLWGVSRITDIYHSVYFNNASQAIYHSLIKQIQGPVTQESLDFISGQRKEIDDMYSQIRAASDSDSPAAGLEMQMLFHDIELREGGVRLLEDQRDALLEKPGDIKNKYWVDEYAYQDLFRDYRYSLTGWLIGTIGLSLWICGIESMDRKKKIYPLLYATQKGRAAISKNKSLVCIAGMLLMFIICECPDLLKYFHIDGFLAVPQQLSDLTLITTDVAWTLGGCIAAIFLLKFLSFSIMGFFLMALAKTVKNAVITAAAGAGASCIITLLCYYFQTDIALWVIQFLERTNG